MSRLVYLCASEEMLESLSMAVCDDYSLEVIHRGSELKMCFRSADPEECAGSVFLIGTPALKRMGGAGWSDLVSGCVRSRA